jgi:hypothetical protein
LGINLERLSGAPGIGAEFSISLLPEHGHGAIEPAIDDLR